MPPFRHRLALLGLCLFLVPRALAGTEQAPPKPAFTPDITPEQVLARTAYLASDELAGRAGGTPGGHLTEEYIAGEYRRMGLAFLGEGDDAPFTNVPLPIRVPKAGGTFVRLDQKGAGPVQVTDADESVPLSFSAETEAVGELVFVGYGLRSKENGIDEYAGLDVKGRVVLVLRHGPNETDKESPWFLGPRRGGMNPELTFGNKVKDAVALGAAAVLFVNDKNHEDDAIPIEQGRDPFPIPVMAVPRSFARAALAAAKTTPDDAQTLIDGDKRPHSFAVPGVTVTVHPAFESDTARNVIALRRGADAELSDEAVIVCAHMDHVGWGWFGSPDGGAKLHPGADDNASGTAALLEVAEALAAGAPMKRTVIFASWCGEEMGLIGSRYYADKPRWPLDRTVACVNLDMVGRYDAKKRREPGLSVGGVPTGSTFAEPVTRLSNKYGLEYADSWWGWRQSDHASFYDKGVPSLFLTTGLHPDYHRSTDTWDKIASEPQARIARMTADLVRELADAPTRPTFAKKPLRKVLGIQMTDTDDRKGVQVLRVFPQLGAGKAGIVRGDRIVAIDDHAIEGQDDIVRVLDKCEAGDKIEVTIVRGTEAPRKVSVEVSGVE